MISKTIRTVGSQVLQQCRLLAAQYSVIDNKSKACGSIFASLVKDIPLNSIIAFYFKTLSTYPWHEYWQFDPQQPLSRDLDHFNPLRPETLFHFQYPESDILLFEEAIQMVKLKPPYNPRDLIDRLHDERKIHSSPSCSCLYPILPA